MKSQSRWLSRALATALVACTTAPGLTFAQAYSQAHAFTQAEGRQLYGRLLERPDGRLVGTAPSGGEFNRGTVYELDPATNAVTILHSFAGGGHDGKKPMSGVTVGPDGNLWGVTRNGGRAKRGTIYRILSDGHLEIVHMFGKDADDGGRNPIGALVLASDGFMYGTTFSGGVAGKGTVFRVNADNSVATIWSISGTGAPRAVQGRLLEGSDGMLYGTSAFGGGGKDCGTVFRLAKDGSAAEVLHSFSCTDGYDGFGGVTEGTDGRLYGVTTIGGAGGGGVAFRLDRDGANFVVLYDFKRDNVDGWGPFGELIEASPGVFMGTTDQGGPSGLGTVFQMTDGGTITTLHSFTGAMTPEGYVDGARPTTAVTRLADGSFAGVTQWGGTDNVGTIFRLSMP